MYSREYRRDACRAGYHAFNERGPMAQSNKSVWYRDPGIAWCYYTGIEAARTKQSLSDALRTLDIHNG